MRTNSTSYTLGYICGFLLIKLVIKGLVIILRAILMVVAYMLGLRAPKKTPIGFYAGW